MLSQWVGNDCALFRAVHGSLVKNGFAGPSGFKWNGSKQAGFAASMDGCDWGSPGATRDSMTDPGTNWVFGVHVRALRDGNSFGFSHTPTRAKKGHVDVFPRQKPPTHREDFTELRRELAELAVPILCPVSATLGSGPALAGGAP